MEKQIMAAITIEAEFLNLIVAEVDSDGQIDILDKLKIITNLGKDIHKFKKVRINTINDICEELKGFKQILKEYKVLYYRAIIYSEIKEAVNEEYVIEQIRLKSGINAEIINLSQERLMIYKSLYDSLNEYDKVFREGTLIVRLKNSYVEISLYSKGDLKFTKKIKIGYFKLKEIIDELQKTNLDYCDIIKSYVMSRLNFLKNKLKEFKVNNLLVLEEEIRDIFKSYNEEYISKNDIKKLYTDICKLGSNELIQKYNFEKSGTENLIPKLVFLRAFLKIAHVDKIYIPKVSLKNGLLDNMIDETFNSERNRNSINDILCSLWYIGEKYNIDKKHSKYVKEASEKIFDSLIDIHKLGDREKFYLGAASILHETGKDLGMEFQEIRTYDIIKYEKIIGLSDLEVDIIGITAAAYNDMSPGTINKYNDLSYEDKILISKLSAILKLSNALDMSHKQKIKDFDVECNKEKIKIFVDNKEDILFEEWSFKCKSDFFREVIGITPIIKYK